MFWNRCLYSILSQQFIELGLQPKKCLIIVTILLYFLLLVLHLLMFHSREIVLNLSGRISSFVLIG